MYLAYAFLADAANYSEGKLGVLGGDFDTLRFDTFPATLPSLSLVVKVRFTPEECGREHMLRVQLFDPAGQRVVAEDPSVTFTPSVRDNRPVQDGAMGVVIAFQSLLFAGPGDYEFRVMVDDQQVGRVPLSVDRAGGNEDRPGTALDKMK
jgi:hypothetical protein